MTPDTGETTAGALRRALRRLAIATVVLYVILIAGGIKVWSDNKHTTETLCEFRADLETRVVGSILFLREHPGGIAGISSKTIVDQITNQQRTIAALADLNCDSSTPPAVLQPLKDNGQPKEPEKKANPKRPRGRIPATRQRQLAQQRRIQIARHRATTSPAPAPAPSKPSPSPSPRTTPGPRGPQGPQGPPGTTPTPSPRPAPTPAPQPAPNPPAPEPPRGPPPNIVERVCAIAPVAIICKTKPLGGP